MFIWSQSLKLPTFTTGLVLKKLKLKHVCRPLLLGRGVTEWKQFSSFTVDVYSRSLSPSVLLRWRTCNAWKPIKNDWTDNQTLPLGFGRLPGCYCSDWALSTKAGSGDISSIFICVKGSHRLNRIVNISSVRSVKIEWESRANVLKRSWLLSHDVPIFLLAALHFSAWTRCSVEGRFSPSLSFEWSFSCREKTGIWLLSFF